MNIKVESQLIKIPHGPACGATGLSLNPEQDGFSVLTQLETLGWTVKVLHRDLTHHGTEANRVDGNWHHFYEWTVLATRPKT